ncbi:hypothetical protein [Halalkalibacter akibai]|uniref:Uncharacterized protein n=1 Tax=Halalkalibacter akibai (strain ATCC 43226 / DSM 21942 / CIP 109018 / JCM 9157 / 1139) TaxID=1236973 RepID=W4QRJ4_HALA3|nr:hypothetical protein [Halalkalibacter akibai]GAE34721.1 hypothetical protein JCM9157_1797 [Halalkalibacter akibai JCM 9157]
MEKQEILEIIEKLRKREIDSYLVPKMHFLLFCQVLLKQEDAIDFRGNAQHGGDTIYTYEPGWTK